MLKTDVLPEFDTLPPSIQTALRGIPKSQRYVFALSGGLDSVVLLLTSLSLLQHQSCKFCAVHVHHGLSPNANQWAEFCESLCEALGVECRIECVQISVAGQGLEAAAREARYQVFKKHISEGAVLLQGHHLNDQAETLLLRLFKGSNVESLSAIPEKRQLGSGVIYRPFLNVARSELESWAQKQKVQWVEDESNQEEVFDRNFVRHRILAVASERWPSLLKGLGRICDQVSSLVSKDSEWCDYALSEIRIDDVFSQNTLSIEGLQRFPEPLQKRVVRYWLKDFGSQPTEKIFERLWSEVIPAQADAKPEICWGSLAVRRFDGRLFCVQVAEESKPYIHTIDVTSAPLNIECECGDVLLRIFEGQQDFASNADAWGKSVQVFLPVSVQQIVITGRQGGEQFHLADKSSARPLKNCFQQWKVPPWLRAGPLVFFDSDLSVVPGVAVSGKFQSLSNARTLSISLKFLA